jgi:multidrug efflux pump subunit AcrA (membrane-fusion protein)
MSILSSRAGWSAAVVLAVGLGIAGYVSRERLLSNFNSAVTGDSRDVEKADDDHASDHDHGNADSNRLLLSDSARSNLGLKLGAVRLRDWWRTASMPGVVTEQPGHSERRITASLNGIIVGVHVFPGQTVRPGDPLLDIQPTGELLTTAQASLLRTLQDLELLDMELKRITPLVDSGTLPSRTKIEKEYEKKRMESQRLIQMQELLVRGLAMEQITRIIDTKTLIREFTIRVPERRELTPRANLPVAEQSPAVPQADSPPDAQEVPKGADEAVAPVDPDHVYSIESIDIFPGKLVAPGDELCDLALHTDLNIVGFAFERETSLVGRAIRERWPIQAIFETGEGEQLIRDGLQIRFAENTIDPASRTLRFHIPLENEVLRDDPGEMGIVYRSWLFKPGQKVKLLMPVEQLKQRIVLPADAVVKEGADAYVFRANGSLLERRAVHVEHLDARDAVLKNNGTLAPGDEVALNQAYQLNLALKKTQGGATGGHGHSHAGHDHAGHEH